MASTNAPALSRVDAERLADRLNREETNKLQWSYVARHSAIEGAWYVAVIDCFDGERVFRRIYREPSA